MFVKVIVSQRWDVFWDTVYFFQCFDILEMSHDKALYKSTYTLH